MPLCVESIVAIVNFTEINVGDVDMWMAGRFGQLKSHQVFALCTIVAVIRSRWSIVACAKTFRVKFFWSCEILT